MCLCLLKYALFLFNNVQLRQMTNMQNNLSLFCSFIFPASPNFFSLFVRNAFGPSFGTVSFSGMVMGAVRVVRTILDAAKQERELHGCVNLILKCCSDCLLSAFDFVNKFTINFAAITGEGYCSSAKMTYELLKRNLLSAVVVETVSTRLLAGTTFVISSLYAILVSIVIPLFWEKWKQVDFTFEENKVT
jgi:Plasma-membrane choline transporter